VLQGHKNNRDYVHFKIHTDWHPQDAKLYCRNSIYENRNLFPKYI
jgi:hypothetical protein